MNLAEIVYRLLGDEKYNKLLSTRYYNKELKKYKNVKKIIYTLVPTHGNLGDQAIAFASRRYLQDNFNDYEVIEINCEDTYQYSKWIKKILNKDDLIFLHGGGNMGNHYVEEENARRYIIENFSDTKIISFTQTMYFSNDEQGRGELAKSEKVYNSHKDLTLIAREEKSYKTMKESFTNCKVILCPDIVLYLNHKLESIYDRERNTIMTCLRSDKETYITQEKKQEFITLLKNKYEKVVISDTVIPEKVNKENRQDTLNKLWRQFSKSKVVITDRLHGMIFCAITKTPCIVIRSFDHKVLESYRWISELNYIRLVEDLNFENVNKVIKELTKLEDKTQINLDKEHFYKLRNQVM